jgi:hypothetical protein
MRHPPSLEDGNTSSFPNVVFSRIPDEGKFQKPSNSDRLRVFENRVLRRIFGPKRDEVTGGWRKLHNEELHNLYFSPSIIRMIKSRRMRWAHREEEECIWNFGGKGKNKETARKTKT